MRLKLFLVSGMMIGVAVGAQAQKASTGMSNPPQQPQGPTNMDQLQVHQRGGVSYSGKVAVANGMLPWDPIPVIVTCNGVVRYRAEADSKGVFTIQSDASQPGTAPLTGCDVAASVPGFKSSTANIAGVGMANSDIGTITLTADSAATATSVSSTYATASKDAMKKFDKARDEWLSRNTNGAEHDLQKAVQIDPQFADAWYELGRAQQANNKFPDALASYQKAVAADAKFVSPYEHIAELSGVQKKWQDVVNATAADLKLEPSGTPWIWYFDALGNYNLGNADAAEASAQKSLAMDPQHQVQNTEQLLAVILANKGELAEALQHLRNSLTYVKPGPSADLIKQQIAQLEKAVPAGAK